MDLRYTATSPIEVWKIVLHPTAPEELVMRCIIPINAHYCLEGGDQKGSSFGQKSTTDTYISDTLDVIQIGKWKLIDNIAHYVPVLDVKDCLTLCGTDTVYNLGLIHKTSGLWSYKYLWQTMWPKMFDQGVPLPKKVNVGGVVEEFNASEWDRW